MSGLTYASYLRLADLLDLQQPQATEAGPAGRAAEHLFIVTHQASELWLRQLLVDLEHAVDALAADRHQLVRELLRRTVEVTALLRQHLDLLATMPPYRFAEFRDELGSASGAQSRQFRELDDALGLRRDPAPLFTALVERCDAHHTSLAEVLAGPGQEGVGGCEPDPARELGEIARLMMDLGRGVWQWKLTHLQLVAGMIGTQLSGTGGSSGVGHLAERLKLPFPELFELISSVQRSAADRVGERSRPA